jgi:hypothetical protein
MEKNKFNYFYILVFVIGCSVGAIFYPSKTITKTVEVQNESDKKTISDLTAQVNTLEKTNKTLKEHIRTIIIKTPDGTEKTEIVRDSIINEEKQTEIKEKFEKKVEELEKEIAALRQKEKTEINKKRFGIEAGILMNRSYYGHLQADLFGPVFVGGHIQLGIDNTIGIGMGLRL